MYHSSALGLGNVFMALYGIGGESKLHFRRAVQLVSLQHIALRQDPGPLHIERPMIDTLHLPGPLQLPVLQFRLGPAHALDLQPAGTSRIEHTGLVGHAGGLQLPSGCHDT